MRILVIAATFSMMASNTNGPAAFAQNSFPVTVTISKLPKQTADASTQVTISKTGSNNDYRGGAVINIPGIGSGNVGVNYVFNSNKGIKSFDVSVSNLPGQGASTDTPVYPEEGQLLPTLIDIPGIGSGTLTLN